MASLTRTKEWSTDWLIPLDLADNWVLLYNGMTTLQDIAVGSGNQTAIRDSDQFAVFMELVGELP